MIGKQFRELTGLDFDPDFVLMSCAQSSSDCAKNSLADSGEPQQGGDPPDYIPPHPATQWPIDRAYCFIRVDENIFLGE